MALNVPVRLSANTDTFMDDIDRSLTGRVSRSFARIGRSASDTFSRVFSRETEKFSTRFRQGFTGSLTAALQGAVIRDPRVLAAFAASVVALFPAIGAAAAGAFTFAFGAGLAGLGIAVAAQSEQVQSRFSTLADNIGNIMSDIAEPFEQTLLDIAPVIRHAFNAFVDPLRNSFERMAPVVTNFTRSVARGLRQLAPVVEPLTNAFLALMRTIGPRIVPAFERMAEALTGVFDAVTNNTDVVVDILGNMLSVIPALLDFVSFLTRTQAAMEDFFDTVSRSQEFEVFAGIVQDTFTGIINVAEDFFRILNRGNEVGQTFGAIRDFIEPLLPIFAETADRVGNVLAPAFRDIAGRLNEEFLPALQRLLPVLQPIAEFILRVLGDALVGALKGVANIVQGTITTISATIDLFVSTVTGDWTGAWQALQRIGEGAMEVIGGAIQAFLNIGIIAAFRNMARFLVRGIWRQLWRGLRRLAISGTRFIIRTVRGFLRAIARFFRSTGRGIARIWRGFWNGVNRTTIRFLQSIDRSIGSVMSGIRDFFRAIWRRILFEVRSAWNGIVNAVNRGGDRVVGFVRSIPGRLRSLGGSFLSAGRSLIQQFINGMAGAGGTIVGVVAGAASQIRAAVISVVNDAISLVNAGIPNSIPIPGAPDINLPNNPIPHLAHGTRNFRGGLAVVGEEGPELVNLPRGSQVIPNQETQQITAAGDDRITVNQVFTGPTTSNGRLREIDWTLRYATASRRERFGGAAI